jgi:hypothetical protein
MPVHRAVTAVAVIIGAALLAAGCGGAAQTAQHGTAGATPTVDGSGPQGGTPPATGTPTPGDPKRATAAPTGSAPGDAGGADAADAPLASVDALLQQLDSQLNAGGSAPGDTD